MIDVFMIPFTGNPAFDVFASIPVVVAIATGGVIAAVNIISKF